MARKSISISPSIKTMLGFEPDTTDVQVLSDWSAASSQLCKPCWELKYCPYGPLVEQFPLLPPTRGDAVSHNTHLKTCLESGKLEDGAILTSRKRKFFEKEVLDFNPEEYPESIPAKISEMECNVFGHICPVIFTAEMFTETSDERKIGRSISRSTILRVARRDNSTCQICGTHLLDSEIEFDHVIPVSRGGSSEEHNIRVTCFSCNRSKSDKIAV